MRTLAIATVIGFVVAGIASVAVNAFTLAVQGPFLGVVAGAAAGVSTAILSHRPVRDAGSVPSPARSH